MTEIEVLRTRGLPFSLMTTTNGLMIVSDGADNNLFTYCPQLGVMRGLGDFDDRPRMYTPKCLQLFDAPVEDLRRMKQEWETAALTNDRYDLRAIGACPKDAPLPFIANLSEPTTTDSVRDDIAAYEEICDQIDETGDSDDDFAA